MVDNCFTCENFGRYTKEEQVGSGSYGTVFKGTDTLTKTSVAIKQIKLDVDMGFPSSALREISFLRGCDHPNVVQLLDVISTENKMYLILEFLSMDLQKYIEINRAKFTHDHIKYLMYQMLSALYYLHGNRIIHRDIKPQNLLMSVNGEMKLGDFGLARLFGIQAKIYTHEVVTVWYRAPELLLGGAEYSTPIDIWSVGCIFAELYNGFPLLMGDSEIGQIFKLFKMFGTPNEEVWPGVMQLKDMKTTYPKWKSRTFEKIVPHMDPIAMDLFKKIMVYDPFSRLCAKECLAHDYFKNIGTILDKYQKQRNN